MQVTNYLSIIAVFFSIGSVFSLPISDPDVLEARSASLLTGRPTNNVGSLGGVGGQGTGLFGLGGAGQGNTNIPIDLCLGIAVCNPVSAGGASQKIN